MTSDEADNASPTLRRIFTVRKVAIRVAIIAGAVWLASPLAIGLAVGAGAGEWLWRLLAVPAVTFFAALVAWASSHGRERRFVGMRAAAEDRAAERRAGRQESPGQLRFMSTHEHPHSEWERHASVSSRWGRSYFMARVRQSAHPPSRINPMNSQMPATGGRMPSLIRIAVAKSPTNHRATSARNTRPPRPIRCK